MRVTEIQVEPEQKRQDRSARHAKKQGRRSQAAQSAQFQPLARPQTPFRVRTLAQQADSGDPHVTGKATWGMSVHNCCQAAQHDELQ